MSITLVSLNIEGHKHLDRILSFLKKEQPDVICFQEVFQTDLATFTTHLNLKSFFFPALDIKKPNNYVFPPLGKIGNALLTRFKPQSVQVQYYKGNPNHLPDFAFRQDVEARSLAWIQLRHHQQIYTIATTHFNWALPDTADQYQAPYLNKLIGLLKQLPDFILSGDFNAPRGQKTFDTLAKLYKDNIPADITTTLDPQLHRVKNLQLVVDGLFTTPRYQVKNIQLRSGLSDHCAIVAQITSSRP